MSDIWFFLSYARLDRETDKHNCIGRFYEDLDERVRALKKIKQGNAGFFDGQSIQQGDDWSGKLGLSLSNCRILLCMYSPAYFDSEYCGKEWAVFTTRLKGVYPKENPPLILPILFHQPEEMMPFPDVASKVQYEDDSYPEVYRNEGLRYMMVRTNQENNYQDFLDACVERIRVAAEKYPLAALDPLPEIKNCASAFHPSQSLEMNSTLQPANVGPRYAEFIYVAARREEIEQLSIEQLSMKPRSERYGEEGELDWKPYLPPDETEKAREVWSYGQEVANKEDFRYQRIPLNTNLVEHITEAQRNNRIVVIIVDTWTLCLKKYREILQAYDREIFWNSVVLIAWNKDGSSQSLRPFLTTKVQATFPRRTIFKDERLFIDCINSPTELESFLSISLQRVKMQIIEAIEVYRKIDSDQVILKPELNGPGGAGQ